MPAHVRARSIATAALAVALLAVPSATAGAKGGGSGGGSKPTKPAPAPAPVPAKVGPLNVSGLRVDTSSCATCSFNAFATATIDVPKTIHVDELEIAAIRSGAPWNGASFPHTSFDPFTGRPSVGMTLTPGVPIMLSTATALPLGAHTADVAWRIGTTWFHDEISVPFTVTAPR